jgi:hypothetical protein
LCIEQKECQNICRLEELFFLHCADKEMAKEERCWSDKMPAILAGQRRYAGKMC